MRFVLPESHTAAHRARHPHAPRRSPWRLLRERPAFAYLAAATLAVTFSQAILESIFAIWAWHRYGFGPRAVGFLLFAVALPALIMQGGVVRLLAPRLGEVRLATAGVLTYVAGLIALGIGATFAVTVAGLLLCGAGLGAYNPSASALASRQSRGHDRGAVLGAYAASASLARVLGPFTSGSLYALLGTGRAVPHRRLRDAAGRLAGATRAGGARLERDLDVLLRDAHRVAGKGLLRRPREHAPVAHIEGGPVQRAQQARGAQPPLAQARIGVGAEVIEREHAPRGCGRAAARAPRGSRRAWCRRAAR